MREAQTHGQREVPPAGALALEGADIVRALEPRLTGLATAARQGGWLAGGIPVLARGDAWLVPVAWAARPASGDLDARELDERISHLWMKLRGACSYLQGDPIGIDLAEPGGYAAALAESGATRADWWAFGDRAVVLMVGRGAVDAARSLALHIVPIGWVWDRRRVVMPATDLRWSWADVVALRDAPASPDSLAEEREEGHRG